MPTLYRVVVVVAVFLCCLSGMLPRRLYLRSATVGQQPFTGPRWPGALVVSCFVTNDRRANPIDRAAVLRITLLSYSRLPFAEVHLMLRMDREDWKAPIEIFARKIFGDRLRTMTFQRLLYRDEWMSLLEGLLDRWGADAPIFISTNDDHPFIDEDTKLMEEGVALISNASLGPWRMAYISHTAEIVQLVAACAKNIRRVGQYWLAANWNLFDGVMLTHISLLKRFVDLRFDQGDKYVARVDGMPGLLTATIPGEMYRPTFLVPLREPLRKFIAYERHPGISVAYIPPLFCPPESNVWLADRPHLIGRFAPPLHWTSAWTNLCWPRPIPPEWIEWMLENTQNFTGRPFAAFKGVINCSSLS